MAIDRSSKLAFVELHPKTSKMIAI